MVAVRPLPKEEFAINIQPSAQLEFESCSTSMRMYDRVIYLPVRRCAFSEDTPGPNGGDYKGNG